jgi:hypothetical protein
MLIVSARTNARHPSRVVLARARAGHSRRTPSAARADRSANDSGCMYRSHRPARADHCRTAYAKVAAAYAVGRRAPGCREEADRANGRGRAPRRGGRPLGSPQASSKAFAVERPGHVPGRLGDREVVTFRGRATTAPKEGRRRPRRRDACGGGNLRSRACWPSGGHRPAGDEQGAHTAASCTRDDEGEAAC